MKKVSIIIACYNHAKFLEQAIESALKQDYPNLEVIVANDGSTDNSYQVAKKFGNDITLINHKNKGVVYTRNNAIKKSTGDYILPLDADDYLASNDVISKMVSKLESEEAVLVYGNYKAFGRMNQIIKPNFNHISEILVTSEISVTSLYTRKVFNKVGGYSEKMKGGYEDWEFSIRVVNAGKVAKLEKIIFNYRTQAVSRNMEADKQRFKLLNTVAESNKEIYAEYVAKIIDGFRKDIDTIKKRVRKQKKIRKFITYFAIVELITILILILK